MSQRIEPSGTPIPYGEIVSRAPAQSGSSIVRAPINHIRKVLGATFCGVVVCRGGELEWSYVTRPPEPILSANDLARAWTQSARRKPVWPNSRLLIIPLRRTEVDPISLTSLLGLLIAHRSDESPDFTSEERRETSRILGAFMSSRLLLAQSKRMESANNALARRAGRVASSRDAAYQVAHEIRSVIGYRGECCVFGVSSSEDSLFLNPIARLSGPTSDVQVPKLPFDRLLLTQEQVLIKVPALIAQRIQLDERAHRVWEYSRYDGKSLDSDISVDIGTAVRSLTTYLDEQQGTDTNTRIIAPLALQGSLVGVVVVSSELAQSLTFTDVASTVALAHYVTPLLAQDRVIANELEDLQKDATLRPALWGIEEAADPNQGLRAVLRLFCQRMRRHLAADQVVLIRWDQRSDKFDTSLIVSAATESHEYILDEDRLNASNNTAQAVIAAGNNGIEWHDTDQEAPIGRFARSSGVRSFYGLVLTAHVDGSVPRIGGDRRPIGVVFVNYFSLRGQSRKNRPTEPQFSESDRRSIRAFARMAGAYLEMYDLIRKNRQIQAVSEDTYRTLSETELSQQDDLEAATRITLSRILDGAIDVVNGTAGALAVPCHSHHDLLLLERRNVADPTTHIPYGQDGGVTGACAESLEPIIIPDSQDSASWPVGVRPLPFVTSSRSEIAIPLTVGSPANRLIGVLNVESQIEASAFGEGDRAMLDRLARAAVIALELASRIRQLRSLKVVSTEIDRADDPREVFEVVLREATKTTGAYAASARLIDASGTYLIPIMHTGVVGALAYTKIEKSAGVPGWVYRRQQLCSIANLADSSSWVPLYPDLKPLFSRAETRAELCVPISWRGDHIGVINLEHVQVDALAPYVDYVQTLAGEAAYVLYQQRLRQRTSRKSDQELVTAVMTFSSAIAHDVKRHFIEISSVLKSQPEPADPARYRAVLDDVAHHAEVGRREAESLLDHATDPIAPRAAVDLVDVIQGVVQDLIADKSLTNRAVEFRFLKLPPNTPRVVCKRQELLWVVKQILINSIEYSRRDDPSNDPVQIDLSVSVQDGIVEALFRDYGTAIEDALVGTLFDWDRRPPDQHGSGRGLALCASIVGALGGNINASAPPDGGLQTTLRLPLYAERGQP